MTIRLPSTAVDRDDIVYPSAIPFLLAHLACIAAVWSGVTWQAVAICVTLYWLRIFAIGAGYHRYFSHRAYSTSRAFQFLLALAPRVRRKKAFCGGPQNTGITILHSDTDDGRAFASAQRFSI